MPKAAGQRNPRYTPPQNSMTRNTAILSLVALAALLAIGVALAPRIPQSLDYHHFADQRPLLNLPNFGDVISNLPFAIVGIWGSSPSEKNNSRIRASAILTCWSSSACFSLL
jgi:hypothetical protein